jgi:hypothetical protein
MRDVNLQKKVSTLPFVSQDLVEATWKKAAAMNAKTALAIQKSAGKLQPELTGFVLRWTKELRPDAIGLALYVMVVVFEMFRATGVKIRKATDKSVMAHWKHCVEQADHLEASGVEPDILPSLDLSTDEPHVLRYVIDALTEDSEDDSVFLTAKEFWHLLATLKTVVDTLHDSATATLTR